MAGSKETPGTGQSRKGTEVGTSVLTACFLKDLGWEVGTIYAQEKKKSEQDFRKETEGLTKWEEQINGRTWEPSGRGPNLLLEVLRMSWGCETPSSRAEGGTVAVRFNKTYQKCFDCAYSCLPTTSHSFSKNYPKDIRRMSNNLIAKNVHCNIVLIEENWKPNISKQPIKAYLNELWHTSKIQSKYTPWRRKLFR